jgi:hypothetical protein
VSKTVIFYRTAAGKCPVQDFLESLPGIVAKKTAGEANWDRGDLGMPNSIWGKCVPSIVFLFESFCRCAKPWICEKESKDACP